MSSLPWFRMYAEAIDDDKLRLLAFEDRWHFVAILCCKTQGVLDTHPETLDRRVAVKLGLQLRDADEVKRRLIEVDLIDEHWQPKAWNKRQFTSDSSANRTRKWRENKKKTDGDGGGDDDEPSPKRHRDCHVTDAKRNCDALDTDTDTDTDTDEEPEGRADESCKGVEPEGELVESCRGEGARKRKSKPASSASPSAPPAANCRGSRLPENWTLPDSWREWAEGQRPDLDIPKVADYFRNHWLSATGSKARKLDWEKTWQNWVIGEEKTAMKKKSSGNGKSSIDEEHKHRQAEYLRESNRACRGAI
jgi:hypothetical protein